MVVASVAWKVRPIESENGFFAHLRSFFEKAADAGADWLVLPELPILELLYLEPKLQEDDVVSFLRGFGELFEQMLRIYSRAFGLNVVSGSHFCGDTEIWNASFVLEGDHAVRQRKNNLTAYERDVWGLSPGRGIERMRDPRVAVLICYDSEFPEAGRSVAEAGAEVIMVPTFTQTAQGFDRVRYSAHARAIENQVFVVQSALVGDLGREPMPTSHGAAAIIAPSHEPFPSDPILAETPLNAEGLAVATLDFDALRECRQHGDVANWRDRHASNWALLGNGVSQKAAGS